jgi:hypothetical protein
MSDCYGGGSIVGAIFGTLLGVLLLGLLLWWIYRKYVCDQPKGKSFFLIKISQGANCKNSNFPAKPYNWRRGFQIQIKKQSQRNRKLQQSHNQYFVISEG